MACPRVYFDITAGGSPVGRIIMEVSFVLFHVLPIFQQGVGPAWLNRQTDAMFAGGNK